jgi:hypothetical protein
MPRPRREPNLRLQALIDEAGLSRKGLARRVNDLGWAKGMSGLSYDHSSVIRWLRGEHPRQPVPLLLAEVFSMSLGRRVTTGDLGFPPTREPSDLGLRFATAWRDTIEVVTALWRSDLERRQFIIDSVFVAGAYATSAIRWLTAPPPGISMLAGSTRQVGRADVDAIREVTQTFHRLDNLFGGGRARSTVVRYLHDEVGPLLHDGRYSEAVGRELFTAAAEMTRLAGWMAYDLEQHGLAQRYLIQALRLAREASNDALGGEILAGMSHQAVYLHRADDALDLGRAAYESAAKAGLPALASESLIMQAHALAIGNEPSACGKALNAAEQAFDRSGAADTPQWLSYFDEAYMAAKFGHCFRELGQGDKAEYFARRSLNMVDGYVRGRTFNVVLLANAQLQQQDLDAACATGNRALDLGSGLQSARTIKYIRDLRRRMSKFNTEPAVSDFQARAHELLPASDLRASNRGHAA